MANWNEEYSIIYGKPFSEVSMINTLFGLGNN